MKTALVTGGTKGIGKEVVSRLSLINYEVYFTSRTPSAIATSPKNLELKLDICDSNSVNDLSKSLSDEEIKLDLLVLNAGYTEYVQLPKTLDDLTPDKFADIINANLLNNYRLLFQLNGRLKPSAHVIFVSSIAAFTGIGSNLAYTLSKSCLKMMASILAKNNLKNIRFNAVAPGLMRTEFTQEFPDEYFELYKSSTPLDRLAEVSDIADVIMSLETTMTFVNGQTLLVDGGYY